jgi:hypothetical protein
LNQDELRVNFLDLRGATLAQALDWTLQPARLNWTVRDGAVAVETTRRMAGVSPWVYDVSLIALPAPEELNKEEDHAKRVEAARQHADAFLQAVRGELPGENVRVEWFAPGQLLVTGEPNTHQRAATVLAMLADDKAIGKLGQATSELRARTAARAKARKDDLATARETARRLEVVMAHDHYAWQLLAAAAEGKLDLEALTELQIAWKRPETSKLLEAKSPGVLLRSWWAVAESARALPQENELQALARSVGSMAQSAVDRVITRLKEHPGDAQASLTVLYAALASQDNAFRTRAAEAIQGTQGDDPTLAAIRTLAAALLAGKKDATDDRKLIELATTGVSGDDLVALTAFASRRAGGDAWDAFRRQQRELMGKQPLAGEVIVLVNRLAASPLPLVAQAHP